MSGLGHVRAGLCVRLLPLPSSTPPPPLYPAGPTAERAITPPDPCQINGTPRHLLPATPKLSAMPNGRLPTRTEPPAPHGEAGYGLCCFKPCNYRSAWLAHALRLCSASLRWHAGGLCSTSAWRQHHWVGLRLRQIPPAKDTQVSLHYWYTDFVVFKVTTLKQGKQTKQTKKQTKTRTRENR